MVVPGGSSDVAELGPKYRDTDADATNAQRLE
jgi:hypothetical protein